MLTVGIKYCGGCMATYDRVAACAEIRGRCPDVRWEYAKEGVCYDELLLIQGCVRRCASCGNLIARHGTVTVCGLQDVPRAAKAILQMAARSGRPDETEPPPQGENK